VKKTVQERRRKRESPEGGAPSSCRDLSLPAQLLVFGTGQHPKSEENRSGAKKEARKPGNFT